MSAPLILRFRGFLERLADQFERKSGYFLAGASILYFAITTIIAFHKPLWNDELYTFYMAKLPSLSDLWAALSTGGEQIPPFFYMLTQTSLMLFGTSELSLRLPEIIGFWAMCLCLYRFISKRAHVLCGFLAMLFPLVTGAYDYASEARPYGLIMGFSGLSLVFWQSATEKVNRLPYLAGLAISLAAAVSCHYYAVFILLPLAFAEAVRCLSLKRIDLPVWTAFALGMSPLLAFLPLIQRAMSYSGTFWAKSGWTSIPEFYVSLLLPAVIPLMTLVVLAAVYPVFSSPLPDEENPTLTSYEWVAIFGFMAIPIAVIALTKVGTGAFTDRYAMEAVVGCGLIFALGARRALNNQRAITAALTLCLCVFFVALGAKYFGMASDKIAAREQTEKLILSVGYPDLPVVTSDSHVFMTLNHYGSPDIVRRLIFLSDPEASLRYLGHNSVEKGMLDLVKPWFGLRVEEYDQFMTTGQRFLVYGNADNFMNWLLSELISSGARVELRGRDSGNLVFLVTPNSHAVNTP
jgi:hypothetical protein